jgi:hypothetical protein
MTMIDDSQYEEMRVDTFLDIVDNISLEGIDEQL